MLSRVEMLRSMPAFRRVATSYVSALKTRSQMHPTVAQRNAFRALMRFWGNILTVSKMFAGHHGSPPLLLYRMLPNPMLAR